MVLLFSNAVGKSRKKTAALFRISFYMYEKMSFVSIEILDRTERLHELKEIVKKFHPVNYDVFKYVITHLNRFSIFY